jgi:hypothetical protein
LRCNGAIESCTFYNNVLRLAGVICCLTCPAAVMCEGTSGGAVMPRTQLSSMYDGSPGLHTEPRTSSQKDVLIDEKAEVHTAAMELAVWVHNENSNLHTLP